MEELAEVLIRPIAKLISGILRVLNFLAFELYIEWVGWTIGWFFYRSVSFGQFPSESLNELCQASFCKIVIVEFTGLAILGSLIYFII